MGSNGSNGENTEHPNASNGRYKLNSVIRPNKKEVKKTLIKNLHSSQTESTKPGVSA